MVVSINWGSLFKGVSLELTFLIIWRSLDNFELGTAVNQRVLCCILRLYLYRVPVIWPSSEIYMSQIYIGLIFSKNVLVGG